MSVDTLQKRHSALTRRRLPWFRRFTVPIPDGTIDQADRQHLLGLYAGIEAGEEAVAAICIHTLGNYPALTCISANYPALSIESVNYPALTVISTEGQC